MIPKYEKMGMVSQRVSEFRIVGQRKIKRDGNFIMLIKIAIIRKINGKYKLYSLKKNPKTGKRRMLGESNSLSGIKKREREIQFFKHHLDDGMSDDNQTKILKRLSNIATYLEEAGFIESGQKVYDAMLAADDSLDNTEDEDCIVDMFINTDEQMNVGGPNGLPAPYSGGANDSPSLLSMDSPTLRGNIVFIKLVKIANDLDQKGLYEEANSLDKLLSNFADDMPKIIENLEKGEENKKTKNVEVPEKAKQNEEVVARSNGKDGTSVTDNGNAGMFSGMSDAYFYRQIGDLEGAYGPTS